MAVVARRLLGLHLFGADLVQALGAAEAVEGMALLHQLGAVFAVDMPALALPIGAVGAADVRAFAPFDAEPAQGVVDLLFRLAGRAHLVGIFDAQDEFATVLAGKAQVEQGDIGGAYVRIAGGRRRDTGTDGGHGGSQGIDA
ncbi:hypothetical protein D3C84_697390 [compost metagenome]